MQSTRVLQLVLKAILSLMTAGFLWVPSVVNAQGIPPLPSPGILPGSTFSFLDGLSEAIGTALTFGTEAKAKRHASLALERIAELQAITAEGDIPAQGLSKALAKLGAHATAASTLALQRGPTFANEVDALLEVRYVIALNVLEEKRTKRTQALEEGQAILWDELLTAEEKGETLASSDASRALDALEKKHSEQWNLLDQGLKTLGETFERAERELEKLLTPEEKEREEFEHGVEEDLSEQRKLTQASRENTQHSLDERREVLLMKLQELHSNGGMDSLETRQEVAQHLSNLSDDAEKLALSFTRSEELLTESAQTFLELLNKPHSAEEVLSVEEDILDAAGNIVAHAGSAERDVLAGTFESKGGLAEMHVNALGKKVVEARKDCLEEESEEKLGRCLSEKLGGIQEELLIALGRQRELLLDEEAVMNELTLRIDQWERSLDLRRKETTVKRKLLKEKRRTERKQLEEEQEQLADERKREERRQRDLLEEERRRIEAEKRKLEEEQEVEIKKLRVEVKEEFERLRSEMKEGFDKLQKEKEEKKEKEQLSPSQKTQIKKGGKDTDPLSERQRKLREQQQLLLDNLLQNQLRIEERSKQQRGQTPKKEEQKETQTQAPQKQTQAQGTTQQGGRVQGGVQQGGGVQGGIQGGSMQPGGFQGGGLQQGGLGGQGGGLQQGGLGGQGGSAGGSDEGGGAQPTTICTKCGNECIVFDASQGRPRDMPSTCEPSTENFDCESTLQGTCLKRPAKGLPLGGPGNQGPGTGTSSGDGSSTQEGPPPPMGGLQP